MPPPDNKRLPQTALEPVREVLANVIRQRHAASNSAI